MTKTYVKLLGSALGLTIGISIFSAASMLLNMATNGIILFQITAFLLAGIIIYCYMQRKGLKQFGFKPTNIKKSLIVFIALTVLVQPLTLGIDFSLSFSTVLLICVQMSLVGFVEEALFRGIFYYFLKNKRPMAYFLFSSIVFGLLHIFSGLNPDVTSGLLLLQILNALLLGGVFSLMYYALKSIYPVMIFHALFNIFASITAPASLSRNLVAVSLLTIGYVLFLVYYRKIVFPKENLSLNTCDKLK